MYIYEHLPSQPTFTTTSETNRWRNSLGRVLHHKPYQVSQDQYKKKRHEKEKCYYFIIIFVTILLKPCSNFLL